LKVDQLSADGSTASVQSTDWGTTSGVSVGVRGTQITLLVVGSSSLLYTITTEGKGTETSTSKGTKSTVITLFIRVSLAITASVSDTVGSASIRESVGVSSTIITIFVSLFHSITTIKLAARATIIINVVLVITFFTSIDNTITTISILAIGSASVGSGITVGNGGVESSGPSNAQSISVITLFTTDGINHTITTDAGLAIHTTTVGSSVAVSVIDSVGEFAGISVIANFSSNEDSSGWGDNSDVSIDVSATATKGAVGETVIGINSEGVTIFSSINNTITTLGRLAGFNVAPGSARSGNVSSDPWGIGISSSSVARFTVGGINNTITTSPRAVGQTSGHSTRIAQRGFALLSSVDGSGSVHIGTKVIKDTITTNG
jgi:hypothetical protein